MDVATGYLIGLGVVGLIALFSKSHLVQKGAMLMFADWLISNAAVSLVGFYHAPKAMAVSSIVCGILASWMFANNWHKKWLFFLSVGFAAALTFHIAYYAVLIGGVVDAYRYYLGLNIVFALQLLIIGTEGVRQIEWRRELGGLPVLGPLLNRLNHHREDTKGGN